MMEERYSKLTYTAKQIRRTVLWFTNHTGSGHTGGSFSQAEILAALYFDQMVIKPAEPQWRQRDRFVLSKGHASPGYYAALALRGYFPRDELLTFHSDSSRLQGHPDMHKTPGVDFTTGSLGQGLSNGIGFALGRQAAQLDFFSYVLLGDGELQEGQIWEAALYAGSRQLSHLITILDNNKVQLAESTGNTLDLGDLEAKWQAFGWQTLICDGHNFEQLLPCLEKAREVARRRPVIVIANTIKGKGVSFMEGNYKWHGKAVNDEEYQLALAELKGAGGGD